jgi:hypothetical protein
MESDQRRNQAQRVNFPIGQRVIVRSNEDDQPYIVGTVCGYEDYGKEREFLLVCDNKSGQVLVAMGVVHHWSEGKAAALDKLTAREQWNVMAVYAAKD